MSEPPDGDFIHKLFKIRRVQFNGRARNIVCNSKDSNQPSPLVTLTNLILLRQGLPAGMKLTKTADGNECISGSSLNSFIYNSLEVQLKRMVKKLKISQNFADEYLSYFEHIVQHLSSILDSQPILESTTSLKGISEHVTVFLELLNVVVYHGCLPDPDEDINIYNEIHGKFLPDLVGLLLKSKSEADQSRFQPCGDRQEENDLNQALLASKCDIIPKIELIEKFLSAHGVGGLTPYGFRCLLRDVPEHSLSLLWIRARFFVLYKHEGVLHILEPDEENHPGLMWVTVENANGEGRLLSSSFTPINLQWHTMGNELVEEEDKAKAKEEIKKQRKDKKKGRKGPKQVTVAKATEEGSENEKASTHHCLETDPATGSELKEPSLRDRFMEFLLGFRKEGCKKPYFMGQVKALEYYENLDLEFGYSLIKDYDENLALSIAASYHSAVEDLRLGLCDYLSVAMIEESMMEQEIKAIKDKINMTATLKITSMPQPHSVQTFKQFTAENVMYNIFQFGTQTFVSTSYVGRMMGKGYLNFILRMHKSGRSWNGAFTERHMFVIITGNAMDFVITLPAHESFRTDYGVADCERYCGILGPHYKSHKDAEFPRYFDKLQSDYMKMPHHDPLCPEPFDRFQKYIGDHMCWKAPLVRSAFVCNLFRVCKSLSLHPDPAVPAPIFKPLDFVEAWCNWGSLAPDFCKPLVDVYMYKATQGNKSRYGAHTFWCALWLSRNTIEHIFEYIKIGVQLITDAIIPDLILEHDLKGALADVVYKVMELNNFDGEFASIWQHFKASETFDELEKLLCVDGSGGKDSSAAAVSDNTPSTAAAALSGALSTALAALGRTATVSAAASVRSPSIDIAAGSGHAPSSDTAATALGQAPSRAIDAPAECVLIHGDVKLRRSDLVCLQGTNWVEDDVIQYMYAKMSTSFGSSESAQKDLLLVQPCVSLYLGNLQNDLPVDEATRRLGLDDHNLLLFPINNAKELYKSGKGTHWSLLVLHISKDRTRSRFIYHDSLGDLNLNHARRLANVLGPLLPHAPEFIKGHTPQQTNTYDCGVFVLALSKVIGKWWMKMGQKEDTDLFQNDWFKAIEANVNQEAITRYRRQMWEDFDEEMRDVERGCPRDT